MKTIFLVFAVMTQDAGTYSRVTALQVASVQECEARASTINPASYPAVLVFCETVEINEED